MSFKNFYPRPPRGGRHDTIGGQNVYTIISIHALCEEGDATGIPSSKVLRDFYPRPPRGGRPRQRQQQTEHGKFLSTPSARRATAHKCPHCAGLHISIHALREEGDLPWLSLCSAIGKFLSTPSARRATDAPLIWATSLMYFYPRPLRGGRQPSVSAPGCNYIFLSTPSARRATGESCHRGCRRDISIHALCEEGDAWARPRPACSGDFYPRPLRGGRRRSGRCSRGCCYFYPRPLRGGRLGVVVVGGIVDNISIHALCEEGDSMWMSRKPLTPYFYPRPLRGGRRGVLSFDGTKSEFLSTPSARRATPVRRGAWSRRGYFYPRPLRGGRPRYLVPPRASFSNFYPRPLRGGRPAGPGIRPDLQHFYPRPLRGGRQSAHTDVFNLGRFLSTPSARRATAECRLDDGIIYISIHALCEEGDHGVDGAKRHRNISIHALCEEGDALASSSHLSIIISIHALCEEGDRDVHGKGHLLGYFYPRPLRGGRPIWPRL